MTQIATVTGLPAPGQAEVAVARQTACGHDCEHCGGCAAKAAKVVVRACTEIPVAVGDRVELYSDNRVLGFAALVYLAPVALFLLGYLLPSGLPEMARYLSGALGFGMGIAGAVICDRRVRRGRQMVVYQITRKL